MLALRSLIGLVVVLVACPVSAYVVWKHPALGGMRLRIGPSFHFKAMRSTGRKKRPKWTAPKLATVK